MKKKKEKIPHKCESIGHRSLWGCCPASPLTSSTTYLGWARAPLTIKRFCDYHFCSLAHITVCPSPSASFQARVKGHDNHMPNFAEFCRISLNIFRIALFLLNYQKCQFHLKLFLFLPFFSFLSFFFFLIFCLFLPSFSCFFFPLILC